MHTKRIAAGYGKKPKWLVTPRGPHRKVECIPLLRIVRDILGYADTAREANKIIKGGMVLVDKIARKDPTYGVGLMDVVEIPEAGQCFRVLPSKKKHELKPIDKKETGIKLCKVVGKKVVAKGKTQLNLHDGTNILVDGKDFKTGDSVVLALPGKKIKETLSFSKGAFGLVVRGRHIGQSGKVGDITPGNEVQKSLTNIGELQTLTEYIFIIGKDKPMITI
jgi:small subunit ribosomal protein S4e